MDREVARFDPEKPVFAPSGAPFSAVAETSDSADARWFDEQLAEADEADDPEVIFEEAAP